MAFDVDGRLNAIHVQKMVIIENQDLLTPLPNNFLITRRIPGAQIREIKGVGDIQMKDSAKKWDDHQRHRALSAQGG